MSGKDTVHALGEATADDIRTAYNLDDEGEQFMPLSDMSDEGADVGNSVSKQPEPRQEEQQEDAGGSSDPKPVRRSWPASEPYKVRQKKFNRLWVEPPSGQDLFELGEPVEWQPDGQGSFYRVVRNDIILAYAELIVRCNGKGLEGPEIVAALNFEDARKLRNSVLDFFL